jgi:hypothetical protein
MSSSCILCVLRVLVVIFFHRKDAKDSQKNTKNKGFINQINRVGSGGLKVFSNATIIKKETPLLGGVGPGMLSQVRFWITNV